MRKILPTVSTDGREDWWIEGNDDDQLREQMHELTPRLVAMADKMASSVCTTNFAISFFDISTNVFTLNSKLSTQNFQLGIHHSRLIVIIVAVCAVGGQILALLQ